MEKNELETIEPPKYEVLKASCGLLCAVFNALPRKNRPFQLESVFNLISATYTLFKIIDKKIDKAFDNMRENKTALPVNPQPL